MADPRAVRLGVKEADADIGRRTLCVVFDETGNEDFKADGAFFAIGGVMGIGPELDRAERRWRAMKTQHFGGPDEPLHASGKMLSREQIDAISSFFERSRLGRFVYIIQQPPVMPPGSNAIDLLRHMLLEDLGRAICERPVLPDDVIIAMELSERVSPKVIRAFPSMSLEVEGAGIPVIGLLTPKIPPSPLLEMADQVAWRGQRQFKEYNPKGDIMPEFASVIPKGLPHARYREIRLASLSGGTNPKWELKFDNQRRVALRMEWSGGDSVAGSGSP